MKAYELVGEVNEQHELHAQLPPDAPVGSARVLVLVPEKSTQLQEEKPAEESDGDSGELMRCIDENKVDTGIEDLAHEHDHYLHGTPKRGRE